MSRLIALALVLTAVSVSACNTVAGLGRDAQAAGRAVTHTAEDVRR